MTVARTGFVEPRKNRTAIPGATAASPRRAPSDTVSVAAGCFSRRRFRTFFRPEDEARRVWGLCGAGRWPAAAAATATSRTAPPWPPVRTGWSMTVAVAGSGREAKLPAMAASPAATVETVRSSRFIAIVRRSALSSVSSASSCRRREISHNTRTVPAASRSSAVARHAASSVPGIRPSSKKLGPRSTVRRSSRRHRAVRPLHGRPCDGCGGRGENGQAWSTRAFGEGSP